MLLDVTKISVISTLNITYHIFFKYCPVSRLYAAKDGGYLSASTHAAMIGLSGTILQAQSSEIYLFLIQTHIGLGSRTGVSCPIFSMLLKVVFFYLSICVHAMIGTLGTVP